VNAFKDYKRYLLKKGLCQGDGASIPIQITGPNAVVKKNQKNATKNITFRRNE